MCSKYTTVISTFAQRYLNPSTDGLATYSLIGLFKSQK